MSDTNQTTRYWVWREDPDVICYPTEFPKENGVGDPLTLGEPIFSGTLEEIRGAFRGRVIICPEYP